MVLILPSAPRDQHATAMLSSFAFSEELNAIDFAEVFVFLEVEELIVSERVLMFLWPRSSITCKMSLVFTYSISSFQRLDVWEVITFTSELQS